MHHPHHHHHNNVLQYFFVKRFFDQKNACLNKRLISNFIAEGTKRAEQERIDITHNFRAVILHGLKKNIIGAVNTGKGSGKCCQKHQLSMM